MITRICSFAVFLSLVSASLWSQESNTTDSIEIWLGGIGCLQDDRFAWHSASVEFDVSNRDSWKGKLKRGDNRLFRLQVENLEGNRVEMTVRRRRVERLFAGTLIDGVLTLEASDGETPDRLVLRRIHSLSPDELNKLTGVYEISPGHRMAISSRTRNLAMTDFKTGLVRRLYPVARDRFVAGPAIGIPDPVEYEVRFDREDEGAISGVSIEHIEDGLVKVAERQPGPIVEAFTYQSFDGTTIAGTLYRPGSATSPCPAVVWVHGSGRVTRTGAGSWPLYFTNLGYSVLAVDKRGVGASEGKYNMPDGSFDNFSHMKRRSKDVSAAINALALREDILGDQIGLVGASQAGWVIPLTVDQCQPSFAIILFGGATPVSVEGQFSRLAAENSSGAKLRPIDELIEELRKYQPVDPGIDGELSRVDYPCFWLYGSRDRSNPSQLCEELINRISVEKKRDFTVIMFPNGNHGLLQCRFGGGAEYSSLQRLVPDLHQSIENWLDEKKLLPKH